MAIHQRERFFEFIRRFELERKSFVIVSVVGRNGNIAKSLFTTAGRLICSIGHWKDLQSIDIEEIIKEDPNQNIIRVDSKGESFELVFEWLRPQISLLVLGAGHVGRAIALNAHLLGYDVTVIDDREEFLIPDRFNDFDIKLKNDSFYKLDISKLKLQRTAVVIVTRGHQYDEQCLRAFINQELDYIGMIGSKRRVLSIFEKLINEGVDPKKLQNVRAPIGLKIGARTPQEIAVSILAEIIQVMNTPSKVNEREQKNEL